MVNKFLIMFTFLFAAFSMTATESNKTDSLTLKQLDEIVVTSLYRSSIGTNNVITNATIQTENHGQNLDYVISKLPNLYAYTDNGLNMGYTYFRMRGMGQERINITYDGIPWNEPEDFGCYFSNAPDVMSSMHSIKVENGASVTNNGSAAYAGNISLQSIDLVNDTISSVEIGGGSFNTFRSSLVYNMGVKNNWGLHVKATQQQTDGYKEHSSNNSQAFTFKLGYFFNKRHSIDVFSTSGFHRNGQGYLGVAKEELPKTLNPFKQVKSGNMAQETDNFLTTYNRIQYNGRVSESVFLTSSIYWNAQNGSYRIGWYDETLPTGKALNNYHITYNMYGVNTTAKWIANEKLSMIGGVNGYYYERNHKGYDIVNTDSIINVWHTNGAVPYYDNKGIKPDLSIFGTVKYSPINKLNLEGSIQYRVTQLRYVVNQAAFNDSFDKPFNHTWNFVNYNISADYTFNAYHNVYAKYSVTNREPSRTDLFGGEYITEESPLNIVNEQARDFEIGYSLNKNNVSVNINLFYIDFKNELVATGELSPINFLPIHKQMTTRRSGIELTASYSPIKSLNVILNGSFLNTSLKDFGTQCTFSPKVLGFVEANYTFNDKIKIGVNSQYRSKMYIDVKNDYSLGAAWTLNAYVNAKINKNIELSLNLNNITNRLNTSNGSVDGTDVYYLVDNPFTFYIGAKYCF